MLKKKIDYVERRLYEYTLRAVSCPLRVVEQGPTVEQLTEHVARLFNVDAEEHAEKYMKALKTRQCSIVLGVDIKKARNLLGADLNGFSDPYCEVSVTHSNSSTIETVPSSSSSSLSPSSSPKEARRSPGLFSCARSPSRRQLKPPVSSSPRSSRSSSRTRSSTISSDKNKMINIVSYYTDIRQQTVNPEWNQHFDFEIDNVLEQQLIVTVYDSDRGQVPGMKTVVREKRGISNTFRGLRDFLTTGRIEDDFLGQMTLDIKSLAIFDREQWFPLTGSSSGRRSSTKQRGEILIGLKIHFKLDDGDKKPRRRSSGGNNLQFRRRQSCLSSAHTHSSIVTRASIFRQTLRPAPLRIRGQLNAHSSEGNLQSVLSLSDSCLTPSGDADLPLLIEEYHQLCRIVMLHELEDARETHGQQDASAVDWDFSLNELSQSVLRQFRVLYNIPILSESFIQLLVVMELRCSSDYAQDISQNVISTYVKRFVSNVRQRVDLTDLDLTDYEKTVFNEIFYLFLGHYKQCVSTDAKWFLPSKENLPNIQAIFETIRTLLDLKLCSNEMAINKYLHEIIRGRLQMDINESFDLELPVFNIRETNQLAGVRDYLESVKKVAQSMPLLREYNKIFELFGMNYMKICFFEENGAADHMTASTRCLLNSMTEYAQIYTRPMVKDTSSLYDPNLIQSSKLLISFYLNLQTIVSALREYHEPRDWAVSAFKLKLIEYRQWFFPIMPLLIEGFVAQTRQVIERAVEDDSDILPDEDIILRSQSSMAAAALCIRLCTEWESIDYPDVDIRYTALVKLTNTMCEQCQHYARRTARKLSENGYFTDLNRTRSFNVSKKLCMFVNDIEYVKEKVLSSLPELLKFSVVIDKMIEKYDATTFQHTKVTLERLISKAKQEMTDVIQLILDHVAALVHVSLQSRIVAYYRDEKRGKHDCMTEVHRYIHEELLQQLNIGLEHVQYSRIACSIRIKTLQCLRELLPLQEPPDFYGRVLISFELLATYFEVVCRADPNLPGPSCEEIVTFRKTLQTYALTTEQLQLLYFREITQIHAPSEYSQKYGEILFRTAYEIVKDLITIDVVILSCRNLPKMDYWGTSDPYVVIELLPESFYRKPLMKYKTSYQSQTLDPDFNETFQIHRLPQTVLLEPGAVLRFSVWDKDLVPSDDFIGECFVPLLSLTALRNVHSLRDIEVSTVQLRRPRKDTQPHTFELIRNRATFDKQAELFVKQRTAIMQSGSGSDGASVRSDERHSTSSYASAALRSLFCMLPFNFGLSSDSNSNGQGTAGVEDEV